MKSTINIFNYTYDPANRLTSVNGQAVQWDDNGREAPLRWRSLPPERGNMLADGQSVYTYNTANKLVGVTKDYTLDINAGLTQVLQDGKQTHPYGNSRIAQIAETQTGYFLLPSKIP